MGNVKLDTVRKGVQLLSKLMKEADQMGQSDGKVTKSELKELVGQFGDGDKMDTALNKTFRYVQASTGSTSPTPAEINKALSTAMRNIAKADKGAPGLSDPEQKKLATTGKAIVDFAVEYEDYTIDDIMSPGSSEAALPPEPQDRPEPENEPTPRPGNGTRPGRPPRPTHE